ncbi:MAG TPA: VIT1/CCC1 transporter family protein, partial [Streptosporangiaceae bacterium]|nr:VIT1/CCC1 transporter family protein [Streptosporangiaceae bacterium]
MERQEIREIYASKGFTGTLLDGVVETITANREIWLGTMMDEELHLQPVQSRDILRTAVVITIATLIGHLIPLLPFVVLPRAEAIVLSAPALFGGRRVLRADARGRLAEERREDGGHRPRGVSRRFSCRPPVHSAGV